MGMTSWRWAPFDDGVLPILQYAKLNAVRNAASFESYLDQRWSHLGRRVNTIFRGVEDMPQVVDREGWEWLFRLGTPMIERSPDMPSCVFSTLDGPFWRYGMGFTQPAISDPMAVPNNYIIQSSSIDMVHTQFVGLTVGCFEVYPSSDQWLHDISQACTHCGITVNYDQVRTLLVGFEGFQLGAFSGIPHRMLGFYIKFLSAAITTPGLASIPPVDNPWGHDTISVYEFLKEALALAKFCQREQCSMAVWSISIDDHVYLADGTRYLFEPSRVRRFFDGEPSDVLFQMNHEF